MNIPNFLLSSENNGNISLTVKGLTVMAIIALLSHYGITSNQGQIVDIVNQIIAVIGGIMTLYGAYRKVINNS